MIAQFQLFAEPYVMTQGGPLAQHGEHHAAHVRAGLPLVAHGLRRARSRSCCSLLVMIGDAGPAQAPAEGDAVTRSRPLLLAGLGVNAALAVLALLTVAPLVWMVSASFMRSGEANTLPPPLLPQAPTVSHYLDAVHAAQAAAQSVQQPRHRQRDHGRVDGAERDGRLRVRQLRFAGRDRLFALLLPSAWRCRPRSACCRCSCMVQKLGLVNSLAGRDDPRSHQHLRDLHDSAVRARDSDRAARRGARRRRQRGEIFRTIVFPLLRPIPRDAGRCSASMSQWNDFLWPLIVLSDEAKFTLPVALASLVGEHVQDTELMMAGSVITVLPVLTCVPRCSSATTSRGIMMGSVKG